MASQTVHYLWGREAVFAFVAHNREQLIRLPITSYSAKVLLAGFEKGAKTPSNRPALEKEPALLAAAM